MIASEQEFQFRFEPQILRNTSRETDILLLKYMETLFLMTFGRDCLPSLLPSVHSIVLCQSRSIGRRRYITANQKSQRRKSRRNDRFCLSLTELLFDHSSSLSLNRHLSLSLSSLSKSQSKSRNFFSTSVFALLVYFARLLRVCVGAVLPAKCSALIVL